MTGPILHLRRCISMPGRHSRSQSQTTTHHLGNQLVSKHMSSWFGPKQCRERTSLGSKRIHKRLGPRSYRCHKLWACTGTHTGCRPSIELVHKEHQGRRSSRILQLTSKYEYRWVGCRSLCYIRIRMFQYYNISFHCIHLRLRYLDHKRTRIFPCSSTGCCCRSNLASCSGIHSSQHPIRNRVHTGGVSNGTRSCRRRSTRSRHIHFRLASKHNRRCASYR